VSATHEQPPPAAPPRRPHLDNAERAFTHQVALFSVASAMIGVCLTAIGLITVVKNLSRYQTVCDGLLALDSLLFLTVTLSSFLASREQDAGWSRAFHRTADFAMLLGLAIMALVSVFLVFTLV
jgi:hypothetical protein